MYSVAVSKRFLFQFPENSVPYYVGLSKVLFECLYGMADGVPEGKSRDLFSSLPLPVQAKGKPQT